MTDTIHMTVSNHKGYTHTRNYYRIAGNFGKVFNLANWRFYERSPNLKIHTGICHVAKFKNRQIVLGTDSPNLMLAKVSRYTVYFRTR